MANIDAVLEIVSAILDRSRSIISNHEVFLALADMNEIGEGHAEQWFILIDQVMSYLSIRHFLYFSVGLSISLSLKIERSIDRSMDINVALHIQFRP